MQDTGCEYDTLVDTDNKLYNHLGLKRSLFKVFSSSVMCYYGEQKAQGIPLPAGYKGVKSDIFQMGGDFMLNSNGDLIMTHPSKQSTDRPSVDSIILKIKENQEK